MTLALTLLTLLGFAWFMTAGMDRVNTTHRMLIAQLLLIVGCLAWSAEWLLLACWLYLCGNTLWRASPLHQMAKLQIIGLLMLGWVVLTPFVTHDMTLVVLMGLAALGLILVSLWAFTAYHMQPNHRDMGLAIAYGSAAVLASSQSWFWLIVMPVFMLPWMWKGRYHWQAFCWVAVMVLASLAFIWPIAAGGLLLISFGAGAYILWPHRVHTTGPDHGRLHYWCLLLQVWWSMGWRVRIIGAGWESAKLWGDRISQAEQRTLPAKPKVNEFFTHPHNEYLHVLFEHGAIGLGLLLAFIGWLGWQAFHVEPLLLIPGVGLCAMAMTTFPWTLPYEIAQHGKQYVTYTPFGCMGAVVMTWILVLLLRAN